MVDIGLLENYLNEDSCSEGDIVEIKTEGSIEQKEDSQTKRKYSVLNLVVSVNGRDITYSPNKDAQDVLKLSWGKNTKGWVGKKFQVKFYPKTSFGITKTAIFPVIIDIKA